MMLLSILGVISVLCLTTTMAQPMSKQGCQEKCGNVTIPYPFGIGPICSANSSFTITCNSSGPFLDSINQQVLNISVHGAVVVNQPVSPMNCSTQQRTGSLPLSLEGSPFTISARYNSFVVLGCSNSVWMHTNETTTGKGCMAICQTNNLTDSSCDGLNCCKATIPPGLKTFWYSFRSIQSSSNGFCGYTFPVDKKWFEQDYRRYRGLQSNQSYPYDQEFVSVPLVLEWELNHTLNSLGTCKLAETYYRSNSIQSDEYAYPSASSLYYSGYVERYDSIQIDVYTDPSASLYYSGYVERYDYVSSTKYCSCLDGYEGNPYLDEGCVDIDECALNSTVLYNYCRGGTCNPSSRNRYCWSGACINTIGGYGCQYVSVENKARIAFLGTGSALGALILLIVAWFSVGAIRKRIKAKRRQELFKRKAVAAFMTSTDSSLEKTKVFSYKELDKATDHYNENRVLGRGGQGTVYKGMLTDGKIVAVKKSKKVEEGDLEDFINEVVILSQVNHRNVVRLLGCCLEDEVPLLVYEFIPNGTLFQHIHDPSEDFPLSWEMRVRIAREVAGGLAYLHSSASAPIYHRDIKSTNILLDEKYRAKISDFGTCKSVDVDQTHFTTRVMGTFGYLDPEYFQSSQFTEKSDVYSFGVLMVELLTGEKAVSAIRAAEGRGLAAHFMHSMEENQLFDILDAMVIKGGEREEIVAIAEIARRCLHMNGKRRPTMKEVAVELEGIHMLKEGTCMQNEDDNAIVEVDEFDDFSYLSGSNHTDTFTQYSVASIDKT